MCREDLFLLLRLVLIGSWLLSPCKASCNCISRARLPSTCSWICVSIPVSCTIIIVIVVFYYYSCCWVTRFIIVICGIRSGCSSCSGTSFRTWCIVAIRWVDEYPFNVGKDTHPPVWRDQTWDDLLSHVLSRGSQKVFKLHWCELFNDSRLLWYALLIALLKLMQATLFLVQIFNQPPSPLLHLSEAAFQPEPIRNRLLLLLR